MQELHMVLNMPQYGRLCLNRMSVGVPKVPFYFFDKLKNEIQNSILRFCFYFNKEDEIQITGYHFHV